MYFRKGSQAFLSVHVGGFQPAGLGVNLQAAWELMPGNGLKLDEPQARGQYSRCAQHPLELSRQDVNERMGLISTLLTARDASAEASADGSPPPNANTSKGQPHIPQV